MRFIHTGDWHLGRMLHGVSLLGDQAYALAEFALMVKDVKPDAIVIAGDIYDQLTPSVEAIQLLNDTLAPLLLEQQIPVILIAGNHDSPERLAFASRLLAQQGLHVSGRLIGRPTPVILTDETGPVYFLPVPYLETARTRILLELSPTATSEQVLRALLDKQAAGIPKKSRAVAVVHTFVKGGENSASERKLAKSGAVEVAVNPRVFAGYQYAALGHLHKPQQLGKETICYAGSLLPYSFAEAGEERGFRLVEMKADGKTSSEWLPGKSRRNLRVVEGLLSELLSNAVADQATDDYIMAVLHDAEPAPEAIAGLRKFYPHLLHIERSCINEGYDCAGNDVETAGPLPENGLNMQLLFAEFFQHSTGRLLTEAETAELLRQEQELKQRYLPGGSL